MIEFTFSDGEEMGVCEDGRVTTFSSSFINTYKQNAHSIARAKSWKTSGDGARFREAYGADPMALTFESSITGVYPTDDGVVYSFNINEMSGIYKKSLAEERTPEAHVINSVDLSFGAGSYNPANGTLAVSLSKSYYNSDIALFNVSTGDYKTLTEGDTADEDPYISPAEPHIIYYASRGVGRTAGGDFAQFSPSAIYKLNTSTLELEEIASDPKFSYFKPVVRGGEVYAIKAPSKVKRTNPILEIILIPYRILQGIVGFVNLFVNVFAGKSLTSGGSNPAKGRDYDSRKIAMHGNLIDVEKEAKKNAKSKDSDYGIVPKDWKIINLTTGEELASGAAAFDISDDGTIYYTNGRRIFSIKEGKRKKLANISLCLSISCPHSFKKTDDLFNF